MKKGRTLPDLAAELQRQIETKADYVADTRRVQFTTGSDGSILTLDDARDDGLEGYRVTEYAHGQIAERVGIPKKYYDRMRETAPAMLDKNVNYWLWHEPENRLIRTLDGKARAVLSDRFQRIDNYDIAEVVLPILGRIPGMEIVSCELTETRMYVKATLPFEAPIQLSEEAVNSGWLSREQVGDLEVGDVIRAGIMFKNSEVGAGKFEIAPFTVVLGCKNGMTVVKYGQSRVHLGARQETGYVKFSDQTVAAQDEAFRLGIRDTVEQIATQEAFDRLVADMKHLPQFKVEASAPAVIEKLAQKHELTEGEKESVLDHLIRGGDLTAWGYVQAVTRTAEDADDYDRASELEQLGGDLAMQPVSEWESLAKVAA
jgi:hypothetical protein